MKWHILLILLLWGCTAQVPHTLHITSAAGSQEAQVSIFNEQGMLVYEGVTSLINISLPKGSYKAHITHPHFRNATVKMNQGKASIRLELKTYNLSHNVYLLPYNVPISPSFSVKGTTVLGSAYESTSEIVPFGNYSVTVVFGSAQANITSEGKRMKVRLEDNSILLSREEAIYALNFLKAYLKEQEVMPDAFQGYPSRFYLYSKNLSLTTADLIQLYCIKEAFNPENFILIKTIPQREGQTQNVTTCYKDLVQGVMPTTIGNHTVGQHLTNVTLSRTPLEALQRPVYEKPLFLSFDVESGRYVPDRRLRAISPCYNPRYAQGLTLRMCDRPELVAWMTPKGNTNKYPLTYPHNSGILGLKIITSLSEEFGIPTTNFIVEKDIKAIHQIKPSLVELTKELQRKGLFEVASHTRYHTALGLVTKEEAQEELLKSRIFLEGFYNTSVYGFRSPYLLASSEDPQEHAQSVQDAGYVYYSETAPYTGVVEGLGVKHFPWNTGRYLAYMDLEEWAYLIREAPYLITLDHPWNMVYHDGETLYENPHIERHYRLLTFMAVGSGVQPQLMRDITSLPT